jgi:hypothetical protein
LGSSYPELRAFIIRIGPQHAGYIIDHKSEFSVERSRKHGISKTRQI